MSIDIRQFELIDGTSSLGESASGALIQAAQAGCDDALNELIQSLRGYLLLVANQELDAGLRAKVGPSDLVQSVLFRAQQNLHDFRGASRQTLLAWLRKILKNEIASTRRRFLAGARDIHREVGPERSGLLGQVIDPARSPKSDIVSNEDTQRLRSAMQRLPVDYRTVVYLRNWEQLQFQEIGRQMKRSEDAAKKLWRRAIRHLKEQLVETDS